MEKETAAILEIVNFIKDRMATKEDLAELRAETKGDLAALRAEMHAGFDAVDRRFDAIENRLTNIEVELRDIRQRLDALESAVQNMSGYAKEIDHLIERVNAIEKHLGLRPSMAA